MKKAPTPRPEVYDLYWHFAAQRQAIFEKRLADALRPWTDDPILQTYKFCNVYRATDRVSQYLIRNVIYNGQLGSPADKLFQIVAFRTFSSSDTWAEVTKFLGQSPTLQNLTDGSFTKALEHTKKTNSKLYTHAFILCANNAYDQKTKHENHVELFRHMFLQDNLTAKLLAAQSLEEIYYLLHSYPLMGDFMSYQVAIDLNYSNQINFSENSFVKAGPGSLRGLQKTFISLGDYTPEETILWMVENQTREFDRQELKFKGLFGRSLHAIDCQGLFCELDKYCRVAAPHLVSSRTHIKTQFTPTDKKIQYFFPPKWGLNKANSF